MYICKFFASPTHASTVFKKWSKWISTVDDLILKTKIHGKIRANVVTKDPFFILIYFRNQNIDAKRNRISRSYHICIHFMFQFVKNFSRRSG